MADDTPSPPLVYEGLDPSPAQKSTIEEVSDTVRAAASRVGDAIEKGRKPGMPLSILSNIAREAPLGSLLVAFNLNAVGNRRFFPLAATGHPRNEPVTEITVSHLWGAVQCT
jgi:hypothetical protein